MQRIRPELKNDPATALGDAPEEEYTFLLVPVAVYSIVSQQAKKEQCSVGEIFQKSLLYYMQSVENAEKRQQESNQIKADPDIVVSRRRR